MIVNALYRYYETLLNEQDSGVSEPGFNKAKVGHSLVLSGDGNLLDIIDLRAESRKKIVAREMDVPEQAKKTSGISANFMCDNCTYALGVSRKNKKEKKERLRECFEVFVRKQEEILAGVEDEGAIVFLTFLHKWDIENAGEHPVIARYFDDLAEGSNIVFKLSGSDGFIHERKAVKEAWDKYRLNHLSEIKMQCLVTGKATGIARLHPSIKGVSGAHPSGASLVSFNCNAFTSYGKEQSFNAPISEEAVFGYTTALNYLLGSSKHRIKVGDTTTVFWAESSVNGLEEDLLGALLYPVPEDSDKNRKKEKDDSNHTVREPQTVKLLHDIFNTIKVGKPINTDLEGINENVNFYILGLAPNDSRLAVRFWHVDRYGNFIKRLSRHHSDMAMIKRYDREPGFISIGMILKETAPQKDTRKIPPLLGGILMRSILTGTPYPRSLYNAIISRIRADREVNYVRAAVIKAYLNRFNRFYNKEDEVKLTVALNEQNRNRGYLLGRLFSLLEKVQEGANPGIKSTIREKYFGSASATPVSVFPILLKLAQHHISKAEYGGYMDKCIEEIISGIDGFPAHLNVEEQGQFMLGYYHQRQALYTKKDKKESV
ncbi:MAG: type I-C CRISPR-associated protein Cas8c/Csd1 [Clostridiales bacterium]|nr:type I-C CRISPR-associated protein Cas8c/Csd1 [Clostridiales bacterium]MCF8022946.1 type I-C CRISPR-associated protein Cas8c/Csd1 [Clostridiales bacterium]